MSENHRPEQQIVAIDIGGDKLDIYTPHDKTSVTLANQRQQIGKFLRRHKRLALAAGTTLLVICEATGGWERHVLALCVELEIACHKAHALQVRRFAQGRGTLAKTDAIDARMLAAFALSTPDLRLYEPPHPVARAIRELVDRRDEQLRHLAGERSRLRHVQGRVVIASLKRSIRAIQNTLVMIELELKRLVASEVSIHKAVALMQSLKGIGPVTATTLVAHLPELGTLTQGRIAALVGLAPYARDSGKSYGKRFIRGGRSQIRRILYMAAMSAIRHNHILKAFYEKKQREGKPHKVAIVAVMRKMIVTLNAMMAEQKPWRHAK